MPPGPHPIAQFDPPQAVASPVQAHPALGDLNPAVQLEMHDQGHDADYQGN